MELKEMPRNGEMGSELEIDYHYVLSSWQSIKHRSVRPPDYRVCRVAAFFCQLMSDARNFAAKWTRKNAEKYQTEKCGKFSNTL